MGALDVAWNAHVLPLLDGLRRDGWSVGLPEAETKLPLEPDNNHPAWQPLEVGSPHPEGVAYAVEPPGAPMVYQIGPEAFGDGLIIRFGLQSPADVPPEAVRAYRLRMTPPADRHSTEDPIERLRRVIHEYHVRQQQEEIERVRAMARFEAQWLACRANNLRIGAGLPPLPADYVAVADRLRRKRKKKRALLVEFMADRDSADCPDVGREVHDDPDASEQTIRMNARHTSDDLAKLGFPVSFHVSGGKVIKEISPE